MNHVFTATSRYLTANGPHTIRQFSTRTLLNAHWEEFSQVMSKPSSLDEAPQDQVKVTSGEGKERPILLHQQPKLVSNSSSSSEEISKKRGKSIALNAVAPSGTRKQPAHSDPSSAKATGVSPPPPPPNEAPQEEAVGEASFQTFIQSQLKQVSENTPERDMTDVVAPSTEVNGTMPRRKKSKPPVPRLLRRLSPIRRSLLRSELEIIAKKLEHGIRVRRWELDKYLKYLEAGVNQYWEPQGYDDKTRAQLSKQQRELTRRFEAALEQLEQYHQVASSISPSSRALLKRLKKAKKRNFYLVNHSVDDEKSQHGEESTLKSFPRVH